MTEVEARELLLLNLFYQQKIAERPDGNAALAELLAEAQAALAACPRQSPVDVERVRDAIWREDHYDPDLCGHGGEPGQRTCVYCEPHDDDTPADWPADNERATRQARAALSAMPGETQVGWREIESAPHAMHFLAAKFDEDFGEWIYNITMRDEAIDGSFTHWRDLPTPPQPSGMEE